jgi:hypothetical protein
LGSRKVPARIDRQGRARRDVVLPLSDAVTTALQTYADRGVFRGFRATPLRRGRVEYQFLWQLRRSTRAVLDVRRGRLTFPGLFPGVEARSALVSALDALVASRTSSRLPAHKRVDARRARVSATLRRGEWSLLIDIRGRNAEYAVQRALNLINELFVALHESYPDYLIERFGLSVE